MRAGAADSDIAGKKFSARAPCRVFPPAPAYPTRLRRLPPPSPRAAAILEDVPPGAGRPRDSNVGAWPYRETGVHTRSSFAPETRKPEDARDDDPDGQRAAPAEP